MLSTVASIYGYLIILLEVLFGLFLAKKMKIKWWHALLIVGCEYTMRLTVTPLLRWLEGVIVGEMAGLALTRIYLFVVPIYILVFRLLKIDFSRGLDFVATLYLFSQGLIHFACSFTGCCCGKITESGMWNPFMKCYVFPTNVYDGLTHLFFFLLVVFFLIAKKWDGGGKIYPVLLLVHGFSRFFWDFFRRGEKTLLNLTVLQIWAIVLMFAGIVWLYLKMLDEEKKEKKSLRPTTSHRKK